MYSGITLKLARISARARFEVPIRTVGDLTFLAELLRRRSGLLNGKELARQHLPGELPVGRAGGGLPAGGLCHPKVSI